MRCVLFLYSYLVLASCSSNPSPSSVKEASVNVHSSDIMVPGSASDSEYIRQDIIAPEKIIVPGLSIGPTSVNEKATLIGKVLGIPDEGDAAMGKAISTWRSKRKPFSSTSIYFTTNFGDKEEASRVSQVRITSPFFSTADRLSIGSLWKDIRLHFPTAKLSGSYTDSLMRSKVEVMDDVPGGIAFEIDTCNRCVGITVHKKSEKAFQTYLTFLPGYHSISEKSHHF